MRHHRRSGFALASVMVAFVASFAFAQDATMKAIRLHAAGGPEALVYEDAPKPTPGPGQALVRVHAAGVNPVDWKLASGAFPGIPRSFPFIPGSDVSGVIESVGEGVTAFAPGEEVFAYFDLMGAGGYAEYVAVDVDALARKPKTIDHAQAAGVPLAALTAWQALVETADIQPGQTVLVQGGAGGVGHFGVQIAKAKGARVIATASAGNRKFLESIGADVIIDYRAERFEDRAHDVDIVLDTVGGETLDRSIAVVKEGGIVVTISGSPDRAKLEAQKIRGTGMLVKPNGAQLAQIAALIEEGKIVPHVGETHALRDAARAWESIKTGHSTGKRVLVVKER